MNYLIKEDRGVIDVRNVSKSFKNKDKLSPVLEDVTFSVAEGEIVTLLGQSGCGKSTLLHIVGGFLEPDSGFVLLEGEQVKRPTKQCMMLFQQQNLLPWRTVFKNVLLGLEKENMPLHEKHEKVLEAIKFVGLEEHTEQFPHQLSGGMQQRVAIARAFAAEPKIILMDEPFAALDTFNRYRLQDELIKMQTKKGTTIILVTHDIDEAVYLSDRVLIMEARPGKIFKEIHIHMSKPRDRTGDDYNYFRKKIFEAFAISGQRHELEFTI